MTDNKSPKTFFEWLGVAEVPNWTKARPLGAFVALFLILLFLFALVALVGVLWQTTSQAFSPKGEGPNLGAGALIAAMLGAPFVIWGTVLKHKTVTFQKEGHITDRINKAVEMLGAEKTVKTLKEDGSGSVEVTVPNIEVRIGAILSLERIAQDSTAYDKGRDHVRVMEILCAYVRENSRAKNLNETKTPFTRKSPKIDIQQVISVIGRRTSEQIKLEASAKYRIDLRNCDLDGVDFRNGDFSAARFWNSRMEAADFSEANLTGTQFYSGLFNFTIFWRTRLHGTRFDKARVCEFSFFGGLSAGNLLGVSIEGAEVRGLHFSKATADDFFGSRDTVVGYHYESDKHAGLQLADRIFLEDTEEEKAKMLSQIDKLEPTARLFLHWNPFTSDDLAAGEFRRPYSERKGLIGWPFDEQ